MPLTNQERVAIVEKVLLAARPHGFIAETVVGPLQTLRDDLASEATPSKPAPEPVRIQPLTVTPAPTPTAAPSQSTTPSEPNK